MEHNEKKMEFYGGTAGIWIPVIVMLIGMQRFAVQNNLPFRFGISAKDGAHCLRTTRTDKAEYAQKLTTAKVEVYVFKPFPGQTFNSENHIADGSVSWRIFLSQVPPHHHSDNLALIYLRHGHRLSDTLTVFENGDHISHMLSFV